MEFALKVVASFLVGGAYVAFVTYISEHINPRIGGVLAGLPSTILISLIFIALTQNDAAAVKAGTVGPAGFGFTVLMIALYVRARNSQNIMRATVNAIIFWLFMAVLVFSLLPKSLVLGTVIFLVGFGIAIASLEKVQVEPNKRIPVSTQELFTRTLVAGILIAVSVILAKTLGPFIGGVAATFPMVVITSLTLIDHKRGKNLMASTAKTIPFGSFGAVAFLIGFHFLAPQLGLPIAMVVSYAISVIFAVIALRIRIQLIGKSNPVSQAF
jgi:uncharacterized membrane protein (GlpM family)